MIELVLASLQRSAFDRMHRIKHELAADDSALLQKRSNLHRRSTRRNFDKLLRRRPERNEHAIHSYRNRRQKYKKNKTPHLKSALRLASPLDFMMPSFFGLPDSSQESPLQPLGPPPSCVRCPYVLLHPNAGAPPSSSTAHPTNGPAIPFLPLESAQTPEP